MKDSIIIVGASGAVGSAIVRYLDASQKYKLVLAGRQAAPLEKLKRSLQSDSEFMRLDVARFNEPVLLKKVVLVIYCPAVIKTFSILFTGGNFQWFRYHFTGRYKIVVGLFCISSKFSRNCTTGGKPFC